MATLHKKQQSGASCNTYIGNTSGGHYGDYDQHLHESTQGYGQMQGKVRGDHHDHLTLSSAPQQMSTVSATTVSAHASGYGGHGLFSCFLMIIVFFILLFLFWWVIFNCWKPQWCCGDDKRKKDCSRVLWSAVIAAIVTLFVFWFIYWCCCKN